MQDNSSAFYKRVGAMGAATALAVSGAFIASPAIAAPAAEPETTAPATATTEAPVDETVAEETVAEETVTDDAAPVEEAPAEEAGALAPGLAEALQRDLGMTVEEFEAAGELGKKAAKIGRAHPAVEGRVAELVREKVRRVLEDVTELADRRARLCDEGDFLKLLYAFNQEGIHFN